MAESNRLTKLTNGQGMQTHLGPNSPTMAGEKKVNSSLAYNPRCLKRDLTTHASSTWLTLSNLHNLTLGPASASIETFQNELQGRFDDGFLGLHAAGHFAIGGDAGDIFSSPNDPVFFLHHAMLDRVWWLWQALHREQAATIAGTITLSNRPPSRNATLDDVVQMNYLGLEARKIGDLLSVVDGPFCYIYL
jgi:tyrosinase